MLVSDLRYEAPRTFPDAARSRAQTLSRAHTQVNNKVGKCFVRGDDCVCRVPSGQGVQVGRRTLRVAARGRCVLQREERASKRQMFELRALFPSLDKDSWSLARALSQWAVSDLVLRRRSFAGLSLRPLSPPSRICWVWYVIITDMEDVIDSPALSLEP